MCIVACAQVRVRRVPELCTAFSFLSFSKGNSGRQRKDEEACALFGTLKPEKAIIETGDACMNRLKHIAMMLTAVVQLLVWSFPRMGEAEMLEAGFEDMELSSESEEAYAKQRTFTPAYGSSYSDEELNYWTLPMDIRDEAAVWEVLMQPITILDGSSFGRPERTQITVRQEPSLESTGLGVVTCMNQGVHVLEKGDEWSLIECYSSSFFDSKVVNWNRLIQGYVQTKYLKEVQPDSHMGMVIDKLTQRLYLFKDGSLYSELMVSTGKSNSKQPYNETRSGEFLLTTRIGNFKSDNLTCRLALRFNSGDLLHEVPYAYSRSDAGYKKQEAVLGSRASHGCIRVQRKMTPEGVNMEWIYDHFRKDTKILIWEDWQGRQILEPEGDSTLYYNPDKGQSYHSGPFCYACPKSTLQPFAYAELDDEPYASLEPCQYCAPLMRKETIAEINLLHAEGGDHDPVLTKARSYCPMPQKEYKKIKGK